MLATEIKLMDVVTPEPGKLPPDPTPLPPAVVNIQNPLAAPDLTGMAAFLNSITNEIHSAIYLP